MSARERLSGAQIRLLHAIHANAPIHWSDALKVANVRDSASITALVDRGLVRETSDGFTHLTASGRQVDIAVLRAEEGRRNAPSEFA